MTHAEIMEKLQRVFRDVFDDEDMVVADSTTADEIEEWDSLAHMQLISAIEETFHFLFSIGEINSFTNVGEMADSIEKHLK